MVAKRVIQGDIVSRNLIKNLQRMWNHIRGCQNPQNLTNLEKAWLQKGNTDYHDKKHK